MSQAERKELALVLAELDEPDAGPPRQRVGPFQLDPALRRERRLALLVAAACCVVLACWIVVLAATLPHRFDAHHWRAVWVNFDVFLLAAFAATAWALWRERQIVILLLAVTGTMLSPHSAGRPGHRRSAAAQPIAAARRAGRPRPAVRLRVGRRRMIM
jgi:hypothetical protein